VFFIFKKVTKSGSHRKQENKTNTTPAKKILKYILFFIAVNFIFLQKYKYLKQLQKSLREKKIKLRKKIKKLREKKIKLREILKTEEDLIITNFLIKHKNYFVNPNANFTISLLTSVLGIDRFVIGQTDIGLVKLLTAGGLGVWAIIDWFQIKRLTQEYNYKKAEQILDIIKG
jgi:hypothetical protein